MKILLGILCVIGLIGCGATKISSEEAFKYERMYAQQSAKKEKVRQEYTYVQPHNKKQACKIATANSNAGDEDYKLFWDGECKDGYAHGLGREFEIVDGSFVEQIGIYEKGKPKGYYTAYNRTQNTKFEGYSNYDDVNYGYVMQVTYGQGDIDIINTWTYKDNAIEAMFQNSPFSDSTMKIYYNPLHDYGYRVMDYSNDEFSKLTTAFETLDSKGQTNGFGIAVFKSGEVQHMEFHNGNIKRKKLSLPNDYLNNIDTKINEATKVLNLADQARKKAQNIETQYKSKTCANKTKVSFMDNEQYFAVCNDDKLQAEIYKLAQDKLALMEKQKAAKREQIYRDKMIALQREQLQQQQWNQLNQTIQNTNNQIMQNTDRLIQQTNEYSRSLNQQTQRMQQQRQHEAEMHELRRLNNNLQQLNNKIGF